VNRCRRARNRALFSRGNGYPALPTPVAALRAHEATLDLPANKLTERRPSLKTRLSLMGIAADYTRKPLGLDVPANDIAAYPAFLWQQRWQVQSEGIAPALETCRSVSVRERLVGMRRPTTGGDEPDATRTKSARLATEESPAQPRVAEMTHQVWCKDLLERPSLSFLPERFAPSNIRRYKARNKCNAVTEQSFSAGELRG
jgi:hypothetical protein